MLLEADTDHSRCSVNSGHPYNKHCRRRPRFLHARRNQCDIDATPVRCFMAYLPVKARILFP